MKINTNLVGQRMQANLTSNSENVSESMERIASNNTEVTSGMNQVNFGDLLGTANKVNAANSIGSADIASVVSSQTKVRMLSDDVSVNMLSQTNQNPQIIAKLLQ